MHWFIWCIVIFVFLLALAWNFRDKIGELLSQRQSIKTGGKAGDSLVEREVKAELELRRLVHEKKVRVKEARVKRLKDENKPPGVLDSLGDIKLGVGGVSVGKPPSKKQTQEFFGKSFMEPDKPLVKPKREDWRIEPTSPFKKRKGER